MTKSTILLAQTGPEQLGQRLDQAAADLFPDYSRGRLQSWIRAGRLTVDGRKFKASHRLGGGETLLLEAEPEPEVEIKPQSIPLNIIHADAHLIVVDKPVGLVVHPAPGNPDGTLQNGLLHFDADLATIPRAGIVHRLDKDTTGVMVVARSLKAHASLVAQLQERSMGRTYEAIVHGQTPREGTVDAPIARHPGNRKRMAVVTGGKRAVTHFRRIGKFGAFSHLRVALETGRTHQIRVHMSHIAYPLVGDPQYGKKLPKKAGLAPAVKEAVTAFPRQALHARQLNLVHPESREAMTFRAPMPEDLVDLLRVLGES